MNRIKSIINKINAPKKDIYNILTFATHESYQTNLSKTGHNFYLLERPRAKQWNQIYRPMPDNHKNIKFIYDDLNIDFILSQDRFGQLQFARDLAKKTRLPLIHLEHTEPQKDRWSEDQFQHLKSLSADINVFITDHNKNSWESNSGEIIHHGIDTNEFQGWEPSDKPYILYVVNHLKERDYFCGYNEWLYIKNKIQEKHPEIEFRLVGDNGPLGQPAKNIKDLISQYKNCLCYLNTSKLSPIPMSLLEAMAVGCPCISTANQQVPSIIKNGYNGCCSNDLDVLVNNINSLINKSELREAMSHKARETINSFFDIDVFINNWNNVFEKAYNMKIGYIF